MIEQHTSKYILVWLGYTTCIAKQYSMSWITFTGNVFNGATYVDIVTEISYIVTEIFMSVLNMT